MIELTKVAHTTAHPGPPIPTIIPPPTEYQQASRTGFRTLWVVFVLMILASASFAGAAWKVPLPRRAFHFLVTSAAVVGTLSYFGMATGQGSTLHCAGLHGDHAAVVCRDLYWARYVDWAVSTPLLLVALCLLAGVDGAHTLMAVAADLVMKLAGLFSALGRERTAQRWGWYAIAWVAYVIVIWHVALHGSRAAKAKGAGAARAFGSLAVFALLLWIVYPIVWAVAGGARKITVDEEILAYAVLDVLTKAGFGIWLLISLRRVPETNVDLDGYWSQGLGSQGRIRIGDDEGA